MDARRLRDGFARTAWRRRRRAGLHTGVPPQRLVRCPRTGLLTDPAAPPPVQPPPPLDPAAIRLSLVGMNAGPQDVAGDFYGYLFAACPHLRDMFPPQMTGQNERLFGALLKIVKLLDKPDRLSRYLTQLGADHRKYGVRPEHYAPVGEALLRALRLHCPAWGEVEEQAWATAYTTAADVMIAGAQSCAGPPAWPARVVRHEMRTRDIAVLTVRTPEPVPYQAGQYVTVQTPRWLNVWRQFSVACAPDGDDTFELHIRAVPGGWVSGALVNHTRPGDGIIIGPPVGTMTADGIDGHDLVCIAGGTGLAPVKALIEGVLARDEEAVAAGTGGRRNIHLFHGARTPLEFYDMPALRELSGDHPWLQVVPVVSGDPLYGGLRGNVADVALGYGDWAGREGFAAGPPEMTRRAVSGLTEAGAAAVHHDDLDAEEDQ